MDAFADKIKDARRQRGWTQEQLASAVGVSRSAVAQWETGRAGQLTGNLAKIGAALGIDPAELIGQGGPTQSRPAPSLGDAPFSDTIVCLGDELALLRLYRACASDDQRLLIMTARRFSRKSDKGL